MEEHDSTLQDAINNDPEYTEVAQRIEENYRKLEKLNYELWVNMDSDVNLLEVIARDIAFNEGFKLAVKLILSSVQ